MKKIAFFMMITLVLSSCSSDDESGIVVIPPRELAEVAAENDAEIKEFLETHFYNYEEFDNPPADFDFKIVLDTIAGDNATKTPLINQVESLAVSVNSDDFGLEDNTTVNHTLYYLSARDGGSATSPTVADSTLVRYEGSFLDGTLFDAVPSFNWQYLPFFLRGYSEAVSKFSAGSNILVNPDGTSEISDRGVGIMFIPSGLAYFNNSSIPNVPQYSVLVFKVDTGLFVAETDYDNDGIPSIMEDLDGDGNLANDNTDREQEEDLRIGFFPNHLDPDDDDDGTPTRDEISDEDGNIIFPYPDTDGDGIPDYLDRDNS